MSVSIKFRIEDEELWPMSVFFSSLGDFRFLQAVETLLEGRGVSTEPAHCEFYDPIDTWWDEPFEGVRFRAPLPAPEEDEEVILTHEDFLKYLRLACEGYLQRHPADEAKLIALFQSKGLKLRP